MDAGGDPGRVGKGLRRWKGLGFQLTFPIWFGMHFLFRFTNTLPDLNTGNSSIFFFFWAEIERVARWLAGFQGNTGPRGLSHSTTSLGPTVAFATDGREVFLAEIAVPSSPQALKPPSKIGAVSEKETCKALCPFPSGRDAWAAGGCVA
jgi:hypothetical protein